MKVGLVMGSCVPHEFAYTARYLARRNSLESTERIVVWQGYVAPFSEHNGFEPIIFNRPIGQERGLWKIAFQLAIDRGWDWCAIIHDDFFILQPEWENSLSALPERIGIAGWVVLKKIESDRTALAASIVGRGSLGVTMDSCGIVFNMKYFAVRNCFTTLDADAGHGDLESSCWCLSQQLGIWQLPFESDHGGTRNARAFMGIAAVGYIEVMKAYSHLFPAIALDDNLTISTRLGLFSVAS